VYLIFKIYILSTRIYYIYITYILHILHVYIILNLVLSKSDFPKKAINDKRFDKNLYEEFAYIFFCTINNMYVCFYSNNSLFPSMS